MILGIQTVCYLREIHQLRWGALPPTSIRRFPRGKKPCGPPKIAFGKKHQRVESLPGAPLKLPPDVPYGRCESVTENDRTRSSSRARLTSAASICCEPWRTPGWLFTCIFFKVRGPSGNLSEAPSPGPESTPPPLPPPPPSGAGTRSPGHPERFPDRGKINSARCRKRRR